MIRALKKYNFFSIRERITKMSKVNHLTGILRGTHYLYQNVSKIGAARFWGFFPLPMSGSITFVQWLVCGAYKYNIWFSRFASERHSHAYAHGPNSRECVGVKINGICHMLSVRTTIMPTNRFELIHLSRIDASCENAWFSHKYRL